MRNMIFTAVLAVLHAGLAQASEPAITDLPALFKVTNISQGDVLNVRAKPSTNARDLGDLQPDQVIEVVRYGVDGKWARIIWQEQEAWVFRTYLTPALTPRLTNTNLPSNMLCAGTEPFWSLSMKNNQMQFRTPETEFTPEPIQWERTSSNTVLRHGIASASWRAIVQKKVCSDGMSDITYGLSIDLLSVDPADAQILSGCCRIQP